MSSRPRIHLAKRTIPTENTSQAVEGEVKDSPSHKVKSNPFGEATAADTASRLEALEIKARHKKEVAQQEELKDKVETSTEQEGGEKGGKDNKHDGVEEETADGEKVMEKRERRDRNQRRKEPRAMNPRAALLGEAPAASSGPSGRGREVSSWMV